MEMEYRTRIVLSQWTAWRWANIIIAVVCGGAPVAIVMGLTSVITQSWIENPFVAFLTAATGFALATAAFCCIMMFRSLGKEAAAGYTTANGNYLQYDEVDGPSGLVVRAAGEPAISEKERKARVAAYLARHTIDGATDSES